MGAFDGYTHILGSCVLPPTYGDQADYQYFNTQSAFQFTKTFGMPELKALLAATEQEGDDTVWVPSTYRGTSGIGLSTWYVRALIEEFDK